MENKSKKYILRFNVRNADNFVAIKEGTKWVETRAGTERYINIKAGDVLVFACGKERLEKKVEAVRHFKTIKAILKVYKVKDIMPDRVSPKELEEAYYGYPNYKEKIKKFGIIALEIG